MRLKIFVPLLALLYGVTTAKTHGAFVVEADNVAAEGKAYDHFVGTPSVGGFQLSVTPSIAVGLSGNQSAFGNPANATGPDRC